MKKLLFVNILLFTVFLTTCSKFHRNHKFIKDYEECIYYFGEGLTSHFPAKDFLKDAYAFSIDTMGYYNAEHLYLLSTTSKKEMENLKNKYINKKICSIDDSCIIAVNDFITESNIPFSDEIKDKKSKISLLCKSDYIIIPNFWSYLSDYRDNTTSSKLNKNFKYIILDSKLGLFSNKIDSTFSSMPNKIKHGYSKGIAFNEKEDVIIYWLVLW